MENIIKSIQVGTSADLVFYSTDKVWVNSKNYVDLIEKAEVSICQRGEHKHIMYVYRGYNDTKLIFEIEAGSGVILTFK